jgi:hypothetical protein
MKNSTSSGKSSLVVEKKGSFFLSECKLVELIQHRLTVGVHFNCHIFFRNPTPEPDPSLGVTWIPVTKTELNYLNIDKELSMQKDLAKDRVAFWEELESSL